MTVALRTLLDGFLAAGLCSYLDDGPGWQVESAGEALIWSASSPPHAEGNRVQWSVTHTSGLQASVVLTGDSAYGAATLQVTLTTTSDHLSAPISARLLRMQRTETCCFRPASFTRRARGGYDRQIAYRTVASRVRRAWSRLSRPR